MTDFLGQFVAKQTRPWLAQNINAAQTLNSARYAVGALTEQADVFRYTPFSTLEILLNSTGVLQISVEGSDTNVSALFTMYPLTNQATPYQRLTIPVFASYVRINVNNATAGALTFTLVASFTK